MKLDTTIINIPQLEVMVDNKIEHLEGFLETEIRTIGLKEKTEKRLDTFKDIRRILKQHKE